MSEVTAAIGDKKRRGAIGLLMAMTLLGVFPIDVLLPSFPALSEHFRTEPADIALSISLFAIGIALSQILIGPLSDIIGRKELLLAGMAVSTLGALGCALSTEYFYFLLFRLVQALGCGCFMLSQALVQDLFEGEQRDRLRILMVTAGGIFISISPLAGTFLQGMMDWQGSFLVFAILAGAVFIKACFFLESSRAMTSGPHPNIIQSYRRVCSNFSFMAYWLISAFAFACHFSFIVISPLIFMEQLQLSAYEFSLTLLVYGAAYIGGGIVATILSRRINSATQINTGLSLILLSGLVMLYLSNRFGLSVLTVLVPMIICTTGTTIARPAATSCAMNLFPDSAGTSVSAGSTLIFIVGGLISVLINLTSNGLQTTLGLCFILLSGTGLALNALSQRRQQGLIAD
ncbi:MFS transporter [Pseudomonas brassicacearum]|uniref:Multidrug transporter CflA n=1 Tax=Pseudomonas brassicacearum TaxID=930166 RepID=A0A423GZ35_9PSED|nr:MFS transporter [Pseudomonas brassicacearum]RON03649.1 multidrug transporter CflA [Pseudomonas brassicacearum]